MAATPQGGSSSPALSAGLPSTTPHALSHTDPPAPTKELDHVVLLGQLALLLRLLLAFVLHLQGLEHALLRNPHCGRQVVLWWWWWLGASRRHAAAVGHHWRMLNALPILLLLIITHTALSRLPRPTDSFPHLGQQPSDVAQALARAAGARLLLLAPVLLLPAAPARAIGATIQSSLVGLHRTAPPTGWQAAK